MCFSILTYCLCFGVKRQGFDWRDKKYMFCIDPVCHLSLNGGERFVIEKARAPKVNFKTNVSMPMFYFSV